MYAVQSRTFFRSTFCPFPFVRCSIALPLPLHFQTRRVNNSFSNLLHFTDVILRNDTSRIIQPEIIYRPDNLGQPNGNTIGNGATNNAVDRKGSSIAIGQSFFYTDYPPTDHHNSAGKCIKSAHHPLFPSCFPSISARPSFAILNPIHMFI